MPNIQEYKYDQCKGEHLRNGGTINRIFMRKTVELVKHCVQMYNNDTIEQSRNIIQSM